MDRFPIDDAKRRQRLYELREFLASAPGKLPEDEWCTFCGKQRSHGISLVRGPITCICNECVALCVEILTEKGEWHE